MKKISKNQKRMKSFDRFELQYAATLMQTGQREEAYETLLPVMDKYPYEIPVLQMVNDLSFEANDMITAWITSYRLMELLPNEAIGYMNAAVAASQLNLPFSVVHYSDLYLQRWANESDANDIRQLKTTWEKLCAEVRKHDPVNTAKSNADLSLLEQANILVSRGDFQEGRRVCQKAIEVMPDTAAPYNNLGLSYVLEGNLPEALRIAQQTVERFPDNFHARCNLAQFLARTGQQSEAQKWAVTLQQDLPLIQESWEKLVESLSYIGDDKAIVKLYQQSQKNSKMPFQDFSPLVKHLMAVALARTGDGKTAEKLWKAILKDDPDLEVAADNLEDIKNSAGEQNGAWAFPFPQWFPRIWVEQVAELSINTHSQQAAKRRVERIFHDNFGMETALQIVLERGDPYGRRLVIELCSIYPVAGLAEFVQSANGTDADRAAASEYAVDHGLLPRGEAIKMFQRGKQTELLFLNYEIHNEPDRKYFPKPVQRLYTQSAEAVYKKDFDSALQLAQKAFELMPNDPSIMNQIALCLTELGKHKECEAILRQNAELHPDYLFARCGMANLCIRNGKLEEAKEWIAPLLKIARFHHSEFRMLALTQAELLKAEGKKDAARSWLNMLEQMIPGASSVPQIKRKSWLR
ncbi:MAG: tetratricopeptide repeat protein [Chloroflexota bacterium]|nr:tetratricopeptide repeat protein [Anaerolineae bacterium]